VIHRPPINPELHVPAITLISSQKEISVIVAKQNYGTKYNLESYLSIDECNRAQKFVSISSRNQFILARAILRKSLASVLETTPSQVPIIVDRNGRPSLDPSTFRKTGIHFSISHTHGVIALAFSQHLPVGIDVERKEHFNNRISLAMQLLSASELDESRPDNSEYFSRIWTLKEAILKACGHGFRIPPNTITICHNRKKGKSFFRTDSGVTFPFCGTNCEPVSKVQCAIAVIGDVADFDINAIIEVFI